MINKLLSTSRINEINAVALQMIELYKKNDRPSDKHLSEIFNELTALCNELTGSINFINVESELEGKDEERDNRTRTIHYLLLAFTYSSSEELKNAATTVNAVFQNYGLAIINKSYAEQSSLTESLLKDFGAKSLQNAIAALPGMANAIEALKHDHRNFEQARVNYEEQKSDNNRYTSATTLKQTIQQFVNERLIVYLRAMAQVDNNKYGTFSNAIAQIIDTNNANVKKRRKK